MDAVSGYTFNQAAVIDCVDITLVKDTINSADYIAINILNRINSGIRAIIYTVFKAKNCAII